MRDALAGPVTNIGKCLTQRGSHFSCLDNVWRIVMHFPTSPSKVLLEPLLENAPLASRASHASDIRSPAGNPAGWPNAACAPRQNQSMKAAPSLAVQLRASFFVRDRSNNQRNKGYDNA